MEDKGRRECVPKAQGIEETEGCGGAGLHHLAVGQALLVHLRRTEVQMEGGRERGVSTWLL